ncbi:MAG: phosphatidate cytidylyltransferase [Actinomycetota bacterium]
MAEGEGRGDSGEDLFEDLDKFFAPIQDVEWPETAEPKREPAQPPAEDEAAEDEATEADELPDLGSEPDGTSAFEEPIRISSLADDEDVEAEAPAPQVAGQEDLFEASDDGSDQEDGVSSFLFETDAEEELQTEGAISEEAFTQAPSAYVDLPSPEGEIEGEDAVAELLEEERTDEPAPDLEAVEAAADHFAESVREERAAAPDAGSTGTVTEEVQIAALLGNDDDDLPEDGEPEPPRTVRVGHEGLGGPSWQEPTALEIGAESERRGPGRDVPMAFLTGLILAALALGTIAIGPGPFAVLAGAVVLFAQGEFYLALQKRHYQPATALGLVSGALVLGAAYYRGEAAMLSMVALGTFASFLWYMTVPAQHRKNVAANVALTVLGIAYIPMLAGYALAVLRLGDDGRGLALAIIGLTIAYDISAFGVGYFWGSRPLSPHVSPKKSWEGAIGATLVVVAVAVGAVANSVDILDTVGRSVGLAVVVAIFAPLGDLAESLLKRDLGIKDMGSILPGHGGVLDRIDSVLFVAPAAFMFLRLILL